MIEDCNCDTLRLPSTGATRCGENMGHVQLLAFEDVTNKETDLSLLANIIVKTKWTAAVGTTNKIQLSPEVKGWEQSGGDPILWGEDVKPNRMPEKVDDQPVQITVGFRGIKQETAAAIAQMKCLATTGRLGVYFFNVEGDVIGMDGTTTIDSFPVGYSNIAPREFIKDEPDNNAFTFYIERRHWDMMKKQALTKTDPTTTADWRGIDLLA